MPRNSLFFYLELPSFPIGVWQGGATCRRQGQVVQAKQIHPPAHRRTGFEVAGWDGARWILEGVFESGAEAASQAKLVLARRLGVKVTEEVFNAAEGVFKSRVVFTEFRGSETSPRPDKTKRPVEHVVATRPAPPRGIFDSKDMPLHLGIASLLISILALIFSLIR
jgi:hypothetical protein